MHEFEATAVVAFAKAPMGIGFSFQEIHPRLTDVLRSWLGELRGEKSPAFEVSRAGQEAALRSSNWGQVANDLINLMVRKRLITENEGSALMRQKFH